MPVKKYRASGEVAVATRLEKLVVNLRSHPFSDRNIWNEGKPYKSYMKWVDRQEGGG